MTKAKQTRNANNPLPPFKVEGMTVKEILALDPDTINNMNERDLSRALRTVSLAANKRINRLRSHAKVSAGVGYIPKNGLENNIATNSLNAVTKDGNIKRKNVFGVKQAIQGEDDPKQRINKMRKQLTEIRRFMAAKTSTITGAKQVRQNRERALFGYTTEQAIKGLSNKQKMIKAKKMQKLSSDVYKGFRKYLEYKGIPNYPYEHFSGSTGVLTLLRTNIETGDNVEEALKKAIDEEEEIYKMQKRNEPTLEDLMNNSDDGLSFRGY